MNLYTSGNREREDYSYRFETQHEHTLGAEGGYATESYEFVVRNGTVKAYANFGDCVGNDAEDYGVSKGDLYTLSSLEECLAFVRAEKKYRQYELQALEQLEEQLQKLPLEPNAVVDEDEDEDEVV